MMHEKAAALVRRFPLHQWALVLGFILFPVPVLAIITVSFESMPGSKAILGVGPVAVLTYGNVSAFEPLPAGVNRTIGASDYTISTVFGVRVTRILSGSTSYTLQARVVGANAVTWQIDGTALSTTSATVGTLQPYATTVPHTLAFVVPFSHPAGAVSTTLEVTAIAN